MSFNKIIEEIKARPQLWCRSHPAYKHRVPTATSWAEVAAKLGAEVTFIKKRWKHLKDQYRKELRKEANTPKDELYNPWAHFAALEFLRSEMVGEEKNEDASNQSDSDDAKHVITKVSFGKPVTTSRKRPYESSPEKPSINIISKRLFKLSNDLDRHINSCSDINKRDPDCMFLLSLLPSVKQLNDIQKLQFRGKINEWLLETITQNEYTRCGEKYYVETMAVKEEVD